MLSFEREYVKNAFHQILHIQRDINDIFILNDRNELPSVVLGIHELMKGKALTVMPNRLPFIMQTFELNK